MRTRACFFKSLVKSEAHLVSFNDGREFDGDVSEEIMCFVLL